MHSTGCGRVKALAVIELKKGGGRMKGKCKGGPACLRSRSNPAPVCHLGYPTIFAPCGILALRRGGGGGRPTLIKTNAAHALTYAQKKQNTKHGER